MTKLRLTWYPRPRHRPANAASLSMASEPGTDYRQPSDCQNSRYLHSSASSRPTSSSTSVLVVAVSRIYRRPVLLWLLWLQMSPLNSTQLVDVNDARSVLVAVREQICHVRLSNKSRICFVVWLLRVH